MQRARAIEILSLIIVFMVPLFAWPLAWRFGIQDARWKAPFLFLATILVISILLVAPPLFVLVKTTPHADSYLYNYKTVSQFHGYIGINIIYIVLALVHTCIAIFLPTVSPRLATLQFWMFHIGFSMQLMFHFLTGKYACEPVCYLVDFHYLIPIMRLGPYIWLLSIALLIALPIWAIIAKSRQGKPN